MLFVAWWFSECKITACCFKTDEITAWLSLAMLGNTFFRWCSKSPKQDIEKTLQPLICSWLNHDCTQYSMVSWSQCSSFCWGEHQCAGSNHYFEKLQNPLIPSEISNSIPLLSNYIQKISNYYPSKSHTIPINLSKSQYAPFLYLAKMQNVYKSHFQLRWRCHH